MAASDVKKDDAPSVEEVPVVTSDAPAVEPTKDAPAESVAQPVSTLNQAVQYGEGDHSTFRPLATLHHGPQEEGESRVDYMNRLSRGGGMDRIIQ